MYHGNPGPRRGKAWVIESHIAGKWHTKAVTCFLVGPLSLMLSETPPEELDHSSLSLSQEDPNDGHPEDALLVPLHLRWRRDALQPL